MYVWCRTLTRSSSMASCAARFVGKPRRFACRRSCHSPLGPVPGPRSTTNHHVPDLACFCGAALLLIASLRALLPLGGAPASASRLGGGVGWCRLVPLLA